MDHSKQYKRSDVTAHLTFLNSNKDRARNEHPYAQALENISCGDEFLAEGDLHAAKSYFKAAVDILSRMPLADQRNLKHSLNKLVYVHLRLFEINEAWNYYLQSKSCIPKQRHSTCTEAETIMEGIKAARKSSCCNSDEYQPSFYSGHL